MKVYFIDNEGYIFQYNFEDDGDGKGFHPENNNWYDEEDYQGSPINPEYCHLRRKGDNWEFGVYEGGHWERGDRDEVADIPGELEGGEYVTFSPEEASRIAIERSQQTITVWDIGTDTPITPADPLPARPDIPRGAVLVISGRAPVWRYGMAFHKAHGSAAAAIATYDPRLGAVIVASHSPRYKVGQIIKVF